MRRSILLALNESIHGLPKTSAEGLLSAAKNNNLYSLIRTLNLNPELALSATTNYGNTAFHCAALRGHLDVVKHFVNNLKKYNLSVNQLTTGAFDDNSPLKLAARFGKVNVIEYLFTQKEQSLDPKDVDSAFIESIRHGSPEGTKCFLQQRNISQEVQNQGLADAAHNGKIDQMQILYQYGHVDLHARCNIYLSDMSALETAIFWNNYNVISNLIKLSGETDKEKIIDAYYRARRHLNLYNDRMSEPDRIFHYKMQNPMNGVIDLSRSEYHHRMSDDISKYFVPVLDGNYFIRNKSAHTIDLSHINLNQGISRQPAQYLHKIYYYYDVCNLIAKNINIKILNLTHTNLNDDAIENICQALKSNTHLKIIITDDNPSISDRMKSKLEMTLMQNRSKSDKPEIDFYDHPWKKSAL